MQLIFITFGVNKINLQTTTINIQNYNATQSIEIPEQFKIDETKVYIKNGQYHLYHTLS